MLGNHGRGLTKALFTRPALALGRLGGGALTHASDLDLIVIYDVGGVEASDGARPLAARAYYARLTQALLQLARNAVQHTQDGDRIHLASRWVTSGAGQWSLAFTVADHGPGVPPGHEKRIFERFHRAGGGDPHHPGAGLGLPIVRAIAEGHGGSVSVAPTPGGGATVHIELPPAPAW